MELNAHLRQLEESLVTTSTRHNASYVASLLADEFREYGSSGQTYSRAEVVSALSNQVPCGLSLDKFEVLPLSDSIALVTYRATTDVSNERPVRSLRSSIWILRDQRWQMLFHQGTFATTKDA